MSQSRAKAQRKATPTRKPARPAKPEVPRSRSTTIDSVFNTLVGLQREEERLRLLRLANAHKPSDPAMDAQGRLLEDDDGQYVEDEGTEDERRFFTYAQREAQISDARKKVTAGYDRKTIDAVRVLMERQDSELLAQVKAATKRG
jgi:hypothetical protein